MLTIKDIARMCNVSPATVSNVMNGKTNKVSEETRALILKTIEESGYKPNFIAKGLRSSKTKLIGVIAEDLSLFNMPPIITGITQYCEERGYMFLLENLRLYHRWNGTWFNDNEKYDSVFNPAIAEMDAINVDGIIYVAGHTRSITSLHQDAKRPVVMAYSASADPEIPAYVIDDTKAAYDMTNYLISCGHKKIGVIGGERNNDHSLLRTDGYHKAMFENGLLYDPEIVTYGPWTRENGYEQAGQLIEKGVTAIFCFADYIAGGVYDYLDEHGLKAGKDICVAGFDDHEFSHYMSPSLTTVALPTIEIGYESAKRLVSMIEGTDNNQIIENKMPCTLIKGKSA